MKRSTATCKRRCISHVPSPMLFRRLVLLVSFSVLLGAGLHRCRPSAQHRLIVADDMGYADVGFALGAKGIRHAEPRPARHGGHALHEFLRVPGGLHCLARVLPDRLLCQPRGPAGRAQSHQHERHQPRRDARSRRSARRAATPRPATASGTSAWQPEFIAMHHGFDEFFGLPYSNDNGPFHPTIRDMPPLPLIEGDKVIATIPTSRSSRGSSRSAACSSSRRTRTSPSSSTCRTSCRMCPSSPRSSSRESPAADSTAMPLRNSTAGIGEVLATLKEQGLEENTLVIFFSDNGPFLILRLPRRKRRPLSRGQAHHVRRRRACALPHALAGQDSRRANVR